MSGKLRYQPPFHCSRGDMRKTRVVFELQIAIQLMLTTLWGRYDTNIIKEVA